MGTFISKLLDELLNIFKKNYKSPRLWLGIFLLIFCFMLLFPYIDSNFLYFSRMEKRINLLKNVMTLDQIQINSNSVYLNEYESILQEMEQQEDKTINSVMNKVYAYVDNIYDEGRSQGNTLLKFLTGAIWCILVTLCVPFMNTFKKMADKILAFIMLIVITVVVGYICVLIPIIYKPMVNYVGIPLLQIILVCAFVRNSNKKNRMGRENSK